jgi:hypothetical protein
MSATDADDYIEQAEAIERVLTRLLGAAGFRDNGREVVILPPPTETQTGS